MSSSPTDLLDAVPALVLALDAAGKIVFWNHRLEQVSGFDRHEMMGQPGETLIRGNGACPLPVKGGGHRTVRWDRGRLPSEAVPGWSLAVGTDITDEQELLARTMRADRLAAVGTLASGLAHEVRNPLNAALLQLTVLRRRLERPDCTPQALRPVADLVEHEMQRLDRLINDFIAFAQPRPLDLRPTDLRSLCLSIAATIQTSVESAGVKLTLEVPDGLPPLQADPERLQHVLLNLARNALEAMPDGGALTLRLRRSEATAEIDVVDTGPGFSPTTPVFDAFFTTKPQGTGLGLSIVHRIVSDHGGSVSVRSQPGDTCFTVSLPTTRA